MVNLVGSQLNGKTCSIANVKIEPGDSGSWVVDASTGRLYGTLVAGLACLGTGYIVPAKMIFSDIRHKAKAGIIEILLGDIDVVPRLPLPAHAGAREPYFQAQTNIMSSSPKPRATLPLARPSGNSSDTGHGQTVTSSLQYGGYANKLGPTDEVPSNAPVLRQTPPQEDGLYQHLNSETLSETMIRSSKRVRLS